VQIYDVVIPEEMDGLRLDACIARLVAGRSRTYLQEMISRGFVTVNEESELSKKAPVSAGDEIHIELPDPVELDVVAEDIPLDIVYEDRHLLVVNKPQGMVVHPAPGNTCGTLVNALMFHCRDLSSINGVVRPGIVHRIDKDTSGLLMVAKDDKAHQGLAEQLKAHTILRRYHALVHGSLREDQGRIEGAIGRNPANRLQMAVVERGGKEAGTHYRVLERLAGYTYVELSLETGRTHQIRVHMAWKGHPLAGDPVYGVKKEKIRHDGQLLHAKTLGFRHPWTGEALLFDSPLPAYFETYLGKVRALGR